jgi:hypothetical protein
MLEDASGRLKSWCKRKDGKKRIQAFSGEDEPERPQ